MDNKNNWENDFTNNNTEPTPTPGSGYVNAGSSGTNGANDINAQNPYANVNTRNDSTQNPYANVNTRNTSAEDIEPNPYTSTQNSSESSYAQEPHSTSFIYNNETPNYNAQQNTHHANYSTSYAHKAHDYTQTSYEKQANASYTPHNPKPPKSSNNFASRAVTLVLAGAVGFCGGYVGSVFGGGNGDIVVQKVERDTSAADVITTSTDGANLSLSEVSALVSPSVVVITTEQMVASSHFYGGQMVESGAGSGVIISSDGYILTCEHVVADASNIIVTIGEQDYVATYIGGDTDSDVAVIKIEGEGFTPAVLGDSDALAVGEGVVAVGNPLGQLGGTVTDGIVSALNRKIYVENSAEMSLIQTNASVSPGNSGGGLFNMAGELIGIVNAKSGDSEAEGLGFAIPINHAYQLAEELITNGYISGRPELGITAIDVQDAETAMQFGVNSLGVYIYGINENSAAEKAGLQIGDRIISIGNKEVGVLNDVTSTLTEYNVGDVITITIARGGEIMNIDVTLGEKGTTAPTEFNTQETQPEEDLEKESGNMPDVGGFNPFG